jgi:N-acetylglutamate synthase-like GNAT family acetyltransferase
MNLPSFRVRRATVDDIKGLTALWQAMNLPAPELEKRLTEFQVAEMEDGQVVGAIGLQITGRQGRLHSEAFKDFAHSDNLRHLLWERIQNIANNHGLTRLWIKDTAPFWDHNGFQAASDETFQKLPAVWNEMRIGARTLQLKDETEAVPISLDKEFALFMESEKSRTEKIFRQARTLKIVATLVGIILFLMVVAIGAFIVLRKGPR